MSDVPAASDRAMTVEADGAMARRDGGAVSLLIARPRLLDIMRDAPATLVVGPPLSGKTMLLRQLRDSARAAGVAIAGRADAAGTDLEAVADRLSSDQRPRLLLLDQFGPEDERLCQIILERHQASPDFPLRVVLAGRRQPSRSMAIARITGDLAEVETDDLAFTDQEAADFLRLDEEERQSAIFKSIMRKTDGWIGGLCHVARQLSRGHDLLDAERMLHGRDALLRSLVDAEILPGLSAAQIEILQRLSPFAAITRKQAENAVAAVAGGTSLADIARDFTFLRPPDGRLSVYRMNPLIRACFEAMLRDQRPDLWTSELSAAASQLLSDRDDLSAAECLLRLGEYDEAAAILERCADRAFSMEGRTQQFFALVRQLPTEDRLPFDRTFWMARGAAIAGAFGYASRLIDQLDPAVETVHGRSDRAEVLRVLVALGFDDFDEVRDRAEPLLRDSARGEPLDRLMVAISLAQASAAQLDWRGNSVALGYARLEVQRVDADYSKAWLSVMYALRYLQEARLPDAMAALQDVLRSDTLDSPIRQTCELLMAECYRQLDRLDDARRLMDRSFRLGARHGVTETAVVAAEVSARLLGYDQGWEAAVEHLRQFETALSRGFGDRARYLVRLLRIEFLLRSGEEAVRRRARKELDEMAAEEGSLRTRQVVERLRLVEARHQLLADDPASARALLQPLATAALNAGRKSLWAEASLLRAAAMGREGRYAAAIKLLIAVLQELKPSGSVRPVLDEAAILGVLSREIADYLEATETALDPFVRDGLRRLVTLMGVTVLLADSADEPTETVHLTPTEHRILQLAAGGLRNADIAQQMLSSVATVKWHLHQIYSKMNVKNRTSAIKRAVELGLM